LFVGNGFGKLTGATQLAELGTIETPVVLTGTLSAFRAADAVVTYLLGLPGNEGMLTVNPVVGETNDGYLSDIRARPVTERHVLDAIRGGVEESKLQVDVQVKDKKTVGFRERFFDAVNRCCLLRVIKELEVVGIVLH
jgi:hypothetical protein